MKNAYYSLIVKFEKGDDWSIQFGDFDRQVVADEIEDAYSDAHKTKIIKTAPDQASINSAVAALNSH